MESIKEKLKNSKSRLGYCQNRWSFGGVTTLLLSLVILAGIKLETEYKGILPIKVTEAAFPSNLSGKEGSFVASKTGKTYYFPWCGAANRIKIDQLVWLPDLSAARRLGYKPAGNCHGLK